MVRVKSNFGAWDYGVFAAMLVISAAIGIFFALRGGKQKTQGQCVLVLSPVYFFMLAQQKVRREQTNILPKLESKTC